MENIYPGVHPSFKNAHFDEQEKKIISVLSKEFYVTNGGEPIRLSENSSYRYILLRPTNVYIDMFNLDREIIVLFSPYDTFQSRTLDALSVINQKTSSLRVDKTCHILISRDDKIEENLLNLIKKEPETPTIIPFTYKELEKNPSDSYYFRNRFQRYLYNRDLFSFEAPLKTDWLFFGRNDLILSIVNRMKSGNNAGVFGLRKTGKTSLINAIERSLKKENQIVTLIDCQDPSFNQRTWNEALHYVCKRIAKENNLDINIKDENKYDEKNASELFDDYITQINISTNKKVFIIFDEIENISRVTSPTSHWRTGMDFVYFWQSLRTCFQKIGRDLSYMIVGTNPSCIENPRIDSSDNPLFNHFSPQYIPGFDVPSTREMIRKIGKRMGMNFEESIYTNINDEYGGHPFLIRKVCSIIASDATNKEKPIKIGKVAYIESKETFKENNFNYLDMILGVLKEHYPEEYDILLLLAHNDTNSFDNEIKRKHNALSHLTGYGILGTENGKYYFIIESMKNYLIENNKYNKKETTIEHKWAEVSERRNTAERELRVIIKRVLRIIAGEALAKDTVLDILGHKRKDEYTNKSLDEIFNPNLSTIYFEDLRKIISKEWSSFENVFTNSKKETFESMGFINKYRVEAHAKEMSDDEFYLFRINMSKIEKDIELNK